MPSSATGAVGAVLANLLGRDGVSVAAFDRDREIYRLPRAVHFDHEVRRVFQSFGLDDADLPQTAPTLGYEFMNGERELLFRFDMDQRITGEGWCPDYMFHQPSLEAALRDAAAKRPSVSVHLEHEVTGMEEGPHDVRLAVRDRANGQTRPVLARYVVGCDGANSFVRKQAGLGLDDLAFDEPWLVVDASIDATPAERGLPTCPTQLCDPARPDTFVPVAGPYIRWEFMLRPQERPDEMLRPERIAALIDEWTDAARVDVIRSAVYDFHALLATSWNTRRVFLAGDAAHQMPPFLGQGLCTGIRDAANLAWKLERVLRCAASEQLLGSYASERKPQASAVIQTAIDMGRIICTQDPDAAAERDASFLSAPGREREVPAFPPLGEGLFLAGAPLAGGRGLQAPVRDEAGEELQFDDAVGQGFVLLVRGAEAPELSRSARTVCDAQACRVVPLAPGFDCRGAYADWLDANGVDAVLVRPDHAVFGGAAGADAASRLLEALGRSLAAGS